MKDKILAAFAALTLIIVVGWISYSELSTSHVTVDVQLKEGEDPFRTLHTILPSETYVLQVREINHVKNEYRLTVKTKQTQLHFLDLLRHNSHVEHVINRSN